MKHYISLEGIHLLSVEPENIGYTKTDFEAGKLIELPENLVELAEQIQFMPDVYDMLFPKKYYYIKSGKVLAMPSKLNENSYVLGSTFDDYLRGAYVELDDDQASFYLAHKNFSIASIWNLGETEPEPINIETVRASKLSELKTYDKSSAVNEFFVNEICAWFEPAERSNYSSSINSAKLLGVETLTFYVGSVALTVPTVQAEQMLATVQRYADQCFIVTKQHENAINALDSIEAIESYDFKTGYPNKLNFTI